jgi:carbon monoxide dehydrogenase subunit G
MMHLNPLNRRAALVACLLAVLAVPAAAHGPSRQKATGSVTLAASPDEVWEVVGNFADMTWYPGVTGTEVSDDGKSRTLTFENGSTAAERLAKHDDEKRVISFRRTGDDLKLIPVTNFSNQIEIAEEGAGAKVTWTAAFYRGFPNNDPPPDLDDAAAMAAGQEFVQSGLDALSERFGPGS